MIKKEIKVLDIKPRDNFWFIFILFFLVFLCLGQPANAQQASFYISPSEGNYKVGESFAVSLFVSVEGLSINAAEATIYFPPEKLRILSISKQNSIFTLWTQEPTFSNVSGVVYFGGGLPSPGYSGKVGRLFTIFFQGKSSGEAKINFGKEKILANDPWGTDVFSFSKGATYFITPAEIISQIIDKEPPHPFEIIVDNEGDPTNPRPLLYFETKDDISGISHYEIKIGDGDALKVLEGETTPFRLPHQAPGTHLVVVKAIDKAQNSTESSVEVRVESIPLPEISICPPVFISGEEILYVAGTAIPNSEVLLFFKKGEKIIKKWEVVSDKKGDLFLFEDDLFKPGVYQITARSKNIKGVISDESAPCFINVSFAGIAVGPLIISYENLTLIFSFVSVIILIGIFYLLWGTRRTRKLIERETRDLKEKFYKEYKELQADIERELEEFKKGRGEREISEEEENREEELLKNLADIKEVFEKELKDIEEIK